MTSTTEFPPPDSAERTAAPLTHPSWFSFRRISAVYVWALLILIFALWVPETFLTTTNFRTLLAEQSITALLALGLTVPLGAAVFDLSVGYTLGLCSIAAAWLIGLQGFPVAGAFLAVLGMGAVIGVINGTLVTRFRIDSFIATLGVASCLEAMVRWISGDETIIGLSPGFQQIATGKLFGLTYPVYYMLGIALVLWYVLEHTPAGRYVYATGGNSEAARLSGVRTHLVVFATLVVSATVAAFAGVMLAASSGAASPTVGPSYLLPAFAAVFLGSTQFAQGRFNIWGTLLAVYVLATGVKGLQLVGAPFWIPALFNGVALLVAVGVSKRTRAQASRMLRLRRVLDRRRR